MIHRWRMRRILLAYSEGALSSRRHEALTRHLERCSICRKTLQTWAEADRLLQDVCTAEPRLSTETAEIVFHRALAEASLRAYRPTFPLIPAFGGVALACALALSLVWLRPHSAPRPSENAPEWTSAPNTESLSTPNGNHTTPFFSLPGPGTEDTPHGNVAAGAVGALTAPSAKGPPPKYKLLHTDRSPQATSRFALLGKPPRLLREQQVHPQPDSQKHATVALATLGKQADMQVGRLFVYVTHEPQISLTVSYETAEPQGYARAACLRPDNNGSDTWATCTVSSNTLTSNLEKTFNIAFTQTHTSPETPTGLLQVAVRFVQPTKESGEKP